LIVVILVFELAFFDSEELVFLKSGLTVFKFGHRWCYSECEYTGGLLVYLPVEGWISYTLVRDSVYYQSLYSFSETLRSGFLGKDLYHA